ncbi:MAG: ATP-binding protein [Dehalococcoidia bacterium]|nr:ATP-binding protein [Dehalococcoidia bacterium]MDW8119140.1 ATP-binding protein [Chloroflexota bacterium]
MISSEMVRATLPSEDLDILRASLPPAPMPLAYPYLIVISGLPGSGKSTFSRLLAQRIPVLLLESDALRKALFPTPTHSPQESARLFRAIHSLIEDCLQKGIPVLLDATNLQEVHREPLYAIAERQRVPLILVWVEAPEEVVRQRLERRARREDATDLSDATWEVYQRMRASAERPRRPYIAVDTSRDITPALEKIVRLVRRLSRIR